MKLKTGFLMGLGTGVIATAAVTVIAGSGTPMSCSDRLESISLEIQSRLDLMAAGVSATESKVDDVQLKLEDLAKQFDQYERERRLDQALRP